MNYIARNIDAQLMEWKSDPMRKPLLLRGARQVGKSSAIRHLGETFQHFAEVNFERNKAIKSFSKAILMCISLRKRLPLTSVCPS